MRQAGGIGIHIVTDSQELPVSRTSGWKSVTTDGFGGEAAAAAGSVAVAVAIGQALVQWLKLPNLSMIFISAVLFSAVGFGLRSAIMAALLSFFAYNFFFIEPIYTFTIADPPELFALLIFLAVAIFTG